MVVSITTHRSGRALLAGVILTATLMLLLSVTPAFAAGCTDCHKPGGIAPDGSAHPVPPFSTVSGWDPRDGQCTICHEVPQDILPTYQNRPYGPWPVG